MNKADKLKQKWDKDRAKDFFREANRDESRLIELLKEVDNEKGMSPMS